MVLCPTPALAVKACFAAMANANLCVPATWWLGLAIAALDYWTPVSTS